MKPSATKASLVSDLREVASRVEELLRASADGSSENIVRTRALAEQSLAQARRRLEAAQRRRAGHARTVIRSTDRYVRDHPWMLMATVAGLSFLFGLLIRRR